MLRKAASTAALAESSAGADLATTLTLFSAPAEQKSVLSRHDRNYVAALGLQVSLRNSFCAMTTLYVPKRPSTSTHLNLQADQAETLTEMYECVGPGASWHGGGGGGGDDDGEDENEEEEDEGDADDDLSLLGGGTVGNDASVASASALESTWVVEVYQRRLRRLTCAHRGIRGAFPSSMRNLNQIEVLEFPCLRVWDDPEGACVARPAGATRCH